MTYVLVKLAADGKVTVFAERDVQVLIVNEPEAYTPQQEIESEKLLDEILPYYFKDVHWPVNLRASGWWRPIREETICQKLDFATAWDRQGPMLVHCYAGVSRSTAAALIILCQYNPGREMEAALALRWAAPHAKPNLRMIAIADQLLKCDGNLIDAVEAMGPGSYAGGQTPLVELPLSL